MSADHPAPSRSRAAVDAGLVAGVFVLTLVLLHWISPSESTLSADLRHRPGVAVLLAFSILASGLAVFGIRLLQGERSRSRQLELELAARADEDLERTHQLLKLEQALREARTQLGLLTMCSWCKSIREGGGDWLVLEEYLERYLNAAFTHGVCPECMRVEYPGLFEKE